MWSLPKLSTNIVTISLNPQSLTCCWIEKNEHSQLILRSYKQTLFSNLECASSIIFNPTLLKQHIQDFLYSHQLTDAFVCMSCSGPQIMESTVTLTHASPNADDFKFPKLKKMIWDYRYLYPQENGHAAFYICGISRHLLLQYQLLALSVPYNLILLTTERMALLRLYHHFYGSAFRAGQLAVEMNQYNHDMHEIFSLESLKRMLIIPATVSLSLQKEKNYLLTHLGLFITGGDLYGAN